MQTVLITGGSRGIGRAMVELFSKSGYQVAFTYKNSENEAKIVAELTGALAIRADSANEAEVASAVSRVKAELGEVDCLINNAGISRFSLFGDISLSDWNEMLAVNLTGAFLYTKAVLPAMINKKAGRIINITSMWGMVGASCEVHYSTAKAGLIGMTKALAKELGPSGITVNAIAPGVIDTEMNKRLTEEEREALREQSPLMKFGTVEDVASAALFLASDKASFITGEVMNLTGGFVV